MIMTSSSLSEEEKQDLPFHLKGNLCRCTGYRSVDDALHGRKSTEEDIAGRACGAGLGNPFGPAIVTGKARYTMDVAVDKPPLPQVVKPPHLQWRHRRDYSQTRPGLPR